MEYDFTDNISDFLAPKTPEERLLRQTDDILSTVESVWRKMNEELRGMMGVRFAIDEMAMYFPDRDLLFTFVSKAVQRGWRLFNYAEDNVTTHPIPGSYEVEYWFLEHLERTYRLELMVVTDGFSPYHTSVHEIMSAALAPAALVHASFKVPSEETYAAAVVALRAAGYELAQHCNSTYGKFSYFLEGIPEQTAMKPRLNMRDAYNG